MIKILVDGIEFERGEEVECLFEDQWRTGKLLDVDLTDKTFCVGIGIWVSKIRKLPKPIPEFDRVVMHVAKEKANPRYVWRREFNIIDKIYLSNLHSGDDIESYEQAYIPDGYTGTLEELEWVKIVDVVRGKDTPTC